MVDSSGAEGADSAAPPTEAPPTGGPPAASELCRLLSGQGSPPIAARQLSYHYNMNYSAGAALPLRLPSIVGGAEQQQSAAHLEAGTTLGQEASRLLRLAGPLFIEGITNIGTQLVATTCVARQGSGPLALSALILAQTQLNFGYSIICGLAAGLETCCGQAFGAGQYALLGLLMQVCFRRAVVFGCGAWMSICEYWFLHSCRASNPPSASTPTPSSPPLVRSSPVLPHRSPHCGRMGQRHDGPTAQLVGPGARGGCGCWQTAAAGVACAATAGNI